MKKADATTQLEEMLRIWFHGQIPFTFYFGRESSRELLRCWHLELVDQRQTNGREHQVWTWREPGPGLQVDWHLSLCAELGAAEWKLNFSNRSPQVSPVLRDVLALHFSLDAPISNESPISLETRYELTRTAGPLSDPNDYTVTVERVDIQHDRVLSAGGGSSANRDFPFFLLRTGVGHVVIAVGWSGQWRARVACPDNRRLVLEAGMEKLHTVLEPDERIPSPTIAFVRGDHSAQATNRMRQYLYRYVCPRRNGQPPLPIQFCNTCYVHDDPGWLNACNERNQLELIKLHAELGSEAVVTDAGWFPGGWPMGVGNWKVRHDAYPRGLTPLASEAQAHGMRYGVWFEPERVAAGTIVHREHPEWLLATPSDDSPNYLLNFGIPAARHYALQFVGALLDIPGLNFYRHDFNINPLDYWRRHDAPDRQGITEIRYIEGLYAFWDEIARRWPEAWRENCAGGGRRFDLETLRRFHFQQISDYHFDHCANQRRIAALSTYIPNQAVVVPIKDCNPYGFLSALPSSLLTAWATEQADFDRSRAARLLAWYRSIRHLFAADYFALPAPNTSPPIRVSQFHDPRSHEGLLLVFGPPESPADIPCQLDIPLVQSDRQYWLRSFSDPTPRSVEGTTLAKQCTIILRRECPAEMVHYLPLRDRQ
jgi:alpha-galactosidase